MTTCRLPTAFSVTAETEHELWATDLHIEPVPTSRSKVSMRIGGIEYEINAEELIAAINRARGEG